MLEVWEQVEDFHEMVGAHLERIFVGTHLQSTGWGAR